MSQLGVGDVDTAISETWTKQTTPVPILVSQFDKETDDPRHFPRLTKFLVALFVSSSTLLVTLATSEYTGAYFSLTVAFGVSNEVVLLGLSLMLFGAAIGPMMWSPLSEWIGRKPVMMVRFSF